MQYLQTTVIFYLTNLTDVFVCRKEINEDKKKILRKLTSYDIESYIIILNKIWKLFHTNI